MEQIELFSILDCVDSSNNYATGMIHAGLAKHGSAWFAMCQTAGRGQRGREWKSDPGVNIMMSVVVCPHRLFQHKPFLLSCLMAQVVHHLCSKYLKNGISIKWPNDIYYNDRKAAGILIENVYRGQAFSHAVIGIGINVNQTEFDVGSGRPVSFKNITGKEYDCISLAKELHLDIMEALVQVSEEKADEILNDYNNLLFKKNSVVKLKKGNAVFETTIKHVNDCGQLLTSDVIERQFAVGEIEWIL